MSSTPPQLSLARLFLRFLRFGVLAWGGPVAQIDLLRQELVDEERWVDPDRFHRVLAVYQALPGPEAFELCVYFGTLARGRAGGLIAGLGFVLPGFGAVLAGAWVYMRHGVDGTAAAALAGAQLAAVALVARSVHRIATHALREPLLWMVAGSAAVATAVGVHFAIVLTSGAAAFAVARRPVGAAAAVALLALLVVVPITVERHEVSQQRTKRVMVAKDAGGATLPELGRAGLVAGTLSFGGAYTTVGFVREDAVARHGWLTDAQFLDGLALAGSLPAPLVVFTTFVGYVSGGLAGALVMTAAIFAPAFLVTLLGHRTLERIVDTPRIHRALDGVTAAVVGIITVTALTLTRSAVGGWWEASLCLAALTTLVLWRSRAAIVLVVGACATSAVLVDLLSAS